MIASMIPSTSSQLTLPKVSLATTVYSTRTVIGRNIPIIEDYDAKQVTIAVPPDDPPTSYQVSFHYNFVNKILRVKKAQNTVLQAFSQKFQDFRFFKAINQETPRPNPPLQLLHHLTTEYIPVQPTPTAEQDGWKDVLFMSILKSFTQQNIDPDAVTGAKASTLYKIIESHVLEPDALIGTKQNGEVSSQESLLSLYSQLGRPPYYPLCEHLERTLRWGEEYTPSPPTPSGSWTS